MSAGESGACSPSAISSSTPEAASTCATARRGVWTNAPIIGSSAPELNVRSSANGFRAPFSRSTSSRPPATLHITPWPL